MPDLMADCRALEELHGRLWYLSTQEKLAITWKFVVTVDILVANVWMICHVSTSPGVEMRLSEIREHLDNGLCAKFDDYTCYLGVRLPPRCTLTI